MALVYRALKRKSVVIVLICLVALCYCLIGARQTSQIPKGLTRNGTLPTDKMSLSTILTKYMRSLDRSPQNTTQNEDTRSWLERTHWESKIDYHMYHYLINPKDKCNSSGLVVDISGNLTLLVLVKSAPGNSELRDAIRNTYIQGAIKYNVSARILFLLGFQAHGEVHQTDIVKEAETNGDIIQEDFEDSYHNLTIKVIMGIKWAMTFCGNSHFVMLTDDDVMFDILTLVEDLSKAYPKHHSEFVLGEATYNAIPFRDPNGNFKKFYTPKTLYPQARYPTYPQGYGYIISWDVVPRVFQASKEIPPPVPWEDVYMGALLQKTRISITDKLPWYRERHPVKTAIPNMLVPHNDYFMIQLSSAKMKTVWDAIESAFIINANNSVH
ncbi:beta-1,3-galactosyltransferase 5-like [Strongylocentrotus purpuratus]|uniref:Hexosyltransferase n=1 Tax=Strongylocentrotus purpuratus TaxID=7668 RepID=A0A7M7PC12_STRPU|nr:beta-1,3-galactosyltransferase 5-like [Strongylocentrotus purpuratus]